MFIATTDFTLLIYPSPYTQVRADMDYAYAALDKGMVPDVALRPVIRQLCRKRLREIDHGESICPVCWEVPCGMR